jgi:hypothetical protein
MSQLCKESIHRLLQPTLREKQLPQDRETDSGPMTDPKREAKEVAGPRPSVKTDRKIKMNSTTLLQKETPAVASIKDGENISTTLSCSSAPISKYSSTSFTPQNTLRGNLGKSSLSILQMRNGTRKGQMTCLGSCGQ